MEDIRSIKSGCSLINIEQMIQYLDRIEREYKYRTFSTGEINVSVMAYECKSMLEAVLTHYDELYQDYVHLLLEALPVPETTEIPNTSTCYITTTTVPDTNANTSNISGTGKLLI